MSEPATGTAAGRRLVPARWVARGGALAVAFSFVALLVYGLVAQAPDTTIDNSLGRGAPPAAPPFRLAVLQAGSLGPILAPKLPAVFDRKAVSLSDLRGTPVVLNIWASWCIPCQAEAPTLERVWREQARPGGVLFLGLDMQDVIPDAQTFIRHYLIDYPNIRDPTNDVARSYGATGVPETFFITAQGRIVGHIIGESTSQQLAQGITAARTDHVVRTFTGGAQGAFN